jgi:uncharacterized protein (TIGR03790 family)
MRIGFAIAFALLVSLLAWGQDDSVNSRVLVVYEGHSKESKNVADYYVRKRRIPAGNLCEISSPASVSSADFVSLTWDQFDSLVKHPIRTCLERVGRNKILYIVFSFQTPYRLSGVPSGYGVSLDQYVGDIWDELGPSAHVLNPYYVAAESRAGIYRPFLSLAEYRKTPAAKIVYSVWRLDAASSSLATGLVDKAMQAERDEAVGHACIDRRFGTDLNSIEDRGYGAGDWDLHQAAEMLKRAGVPVEEDASATEFGTSPAPLRCDGAIFYAGWYSLNHYNDAFSWMLGAVGVHLDSLSAADPRGGPNWAANAIKNGITITSGALDEPDLEGLPHVDGIVHDLLAGANVGDAFLRNTAWLKWMIINIGDPLFRPKFPKTA